MRTLLEFSAKKKPGAREFAETTLKERAENPISTIDIRRRGVPFHPQTAVPNQLVHLLREKNVHSLDTRTQSLHFSARKADPQEWPEAASGRAGRKRPPKTYPYG